MKRRLRYIWQEIVFWVDEHLPQQCCRCQAWTTKSTGEQVPHKIAGMVWVCRKCYQELYPDGRIT